MKSDSTLRPYRQTARAQAASETADRILRAFVVRMEQGWFDEIRLEDVATDAEVTVQTVIRRFGGRDGLLSAAEAVMKEDITNARQVLKGDVRRALDAIVAEYESLGSLIIRLLAQEQRYPPIKAVTDTGRAIHREWVGTIFEPWLDRMIPDARTRAHDELVIALDVYVWKLLRLDLRRTVEDYRTTMLDLCGGALGVAPETLEAETHLPSETPNG